MVGETSDTIAAISTALGPAGIGIVRVSGPDALQVGLKAFQTESGRPPRNRVVTLGRLVDSDDGSHIDEAMITYMAAPHSYTREDVVEVSCHGGLAAVRAALRSVVNAGARQARPGEFTLRAFLSGRIDLAQAEAVADAVRAPTDLTLKAAQKQLTGALSDEVRTLRTKCLDLLAHMEAEIDFSEDDVPPLPRPDLKGQLVDIAEAIERAIEGSSQGILLRHGLRLAIVGAPNVGKSSLLNALLRADRAIVTELPGTTRDLLEEGLSLDGVPVVVVDTAGIRGTTDVVEAEGIQRSKRALGEADLVLFVLDASKAVSESDREVAKLVRDSRRPALLVLNKRDLPAETSAATAAELLPDTKPVSACALSDPGVEPVRAAIIREIGAGSLTTGEVPLVSNERHREALVRAGGCVQSSLTAVNDSLPSDFISIGLHGAVRDLGQITGEDATEDLLEAIFSKFCIGK